MYIKLSRISSKGATLDCVINLDLVADIVEKEQEPTCTYNEDGTIASSTPNPNYYLVVLTTGAKFKLDKANYDTLVNALVK